MRQLHAGERFFLTLLSVSISLPLVNAYQQAGFDALGDTTRRAILDQLRRGPMPVGKLAERFPISRPAISQHLRVLKKARLVTDRSDGTRRLYRIDERGVEELRAYFDNFWDGALKAFQRRVEER